LQAIATQVSGLHDSLLGQANQVVQGRPLFGGVTSGTTAYAADGSYVGVGGAKGVDAPVTRRVSDTETVRVDITGPEAFGEDDSSNLFALTKNIATHAAAGDNAALSDDLGQLTKTISRMSTALADVGTRSARLQTAATANSTANLTLTSRLADTENVDMPKTIMQMQQQQVSYQAALQTTAKVLQPTLLDFLR